MTALPCLLQDELIERLGGVDRVAEMSGRKKRMVKQPDGSYKYLSRSGNGIPLDGVSLLPARANVRLPKLWVTASVATPDTHLYCLTEHSSYILGAVHQLVS